MGIRKILLASTLSSILLPTISSALVLGGEDVVFDTKDNNKSLGVYSNSKAKQTIIVQVQEPLSLSQKESLYEDGIENIVYAGDLSYYFYATSEVIKNILDSREFILSYSTMEVEFTTPPSLHSDNILGTYSMNDMLDINVLFLKEMSEDDLIDYFDKYGLDIYINMAMPSLRSAKIKLFVSELEKLKKLPLVQYIEEIHTISTLSVEKISKKVDRNLKSAHYSNVDQLWGGEYQLNGEGMKVGVVDGGATRVTHNEFIKLGTSRVILEKNNDIYNAHATHVAGTIGAMGVDEKAHGMANDVTIYSYSFDNSAFADASVDMYNKYGVLFSNHSYGYNEKIQLGEYDSEASTQDRAIYSNPYLNLFEASGNDGIDDSYPEYGFIKGPGNSKNIFTIGALDLAAKNVADYSSKGPTSDGRIKPELCTRGSYVYSSAPDKDDHYEWMSGTSMASPSATGIGILVAQQFQMITGGYEIRHDILKSVLANTAIDKGRKGPDYEVGFGLIDAKAAVDTVRSLDSTSPLIYSGKMLHGDRKEFTFELKSSNLFKATISWVDPEANPAHNQSLVNDIDIWLENIESGKKYYPFTLDKDNPTKLATANKLNKVDNIEQVLVENLPAGIYKFIVKGERIISDDQEYAIASNISISPLSNISTILPSKIENYAKIIQKSIL